MTGGDGDDLLIGDERGNRLIAYGGRDVLRGGGGPDELLGWGDGDELDAGPGRDRVQAGLLDRARLADGEVDRLNCHSRAPVVEADALDLLRTCAPPVDVRPAGRPHAGLAACPAPALPSRQRRVMQGAGLVSPPPRAPGLAYGALRADRARPARARHRPAPRLPAPGHVPLRHHAQPPGRRARLGHRDASVFACLPRCETPSEARWGTI